MRVGIVFVGSERKEDEVGLVGGFDVRESTYGCRNSAAEPAYGDALSHGKCAARNIIYALFE
jgi:hypothetical protein